ncbi:nitrate/nitrite transporter [Thermodesulfobacteriota bacterium]
MSKNRLVLCVCTAEIFSLTAIMYFPALLPGFQAEWGLTNTEAGWISGIYYGGYAISVPILVSLTDRMDSRRIYLVSAGLSAISLIGFGWLARGTWTAAILRLLAGVSFAGTYMPGLKALSDKVTGPDQSRAVAFYTSSISVGTALSVFLAGWLSQGVGWRWAAGLMALGPIVGAVLFGMAVRPAKVQALAPEDRPSLLDFRPALRNRPVMGYMFGYAVHCWELFGFRSWLVAFLFFSSSLHPTADLGISLQNLATIIILAGVPASILGNEGALRWGRRRVIRTVMIVSGLLGSLIGFSAGLPFMFVVGFCFLYWIAATGDSGSLTAGMISTSLNGERGRTMALYSFIGFSMAFLAPLAVGGLLDLSGGGIVGWGLAFAALGLVQMTGPVWLKIFRSSREA